MLKLSQLDRALKHEEMLDRSRDRAKYPQPEHTAPAVPPPDSMEVLAAAADLVDAIAQRETKGSALALVLRYRKACFAELAAAPSVAPEPPKSAAYLWSLDASADGGHVERVYSCDGTNSPFGEPGEDHSEQYPVTVTPLFAHPPRAPLTDADIETGREAIFSTSNPYCPCDSKTMRKAVRWAEAKHGISAAAIGADGGRSEK